MAERLGDGRTCRMRNEGSLTEQKCIHHSLGDVGWMGGLWVVGWLYLQVSSSHLDLAEPRNYLVSAPGCRKSFCPPKEEVENSSGKWMCLTYAYLVSQPGKGAWGNELNYYANDGSMSWAGNVEMCAPHKQNTRNVCRGHTQSSWSLKQPEARRRSCFPGGQAT